MAAKVDHYEDSDLPDHQKVALRLTDAMIGYPAAIDQTLRDAVLTHFRAEQVVELLLDIVKWSTQKVQVALALDAEVSPDRVTYFDFTDSGKLGWMSPELREPQ